MQIVAKTAKFWFKQNKLCLANAIHIFSTVAKWVPLKNIGWDLEWVNKCLKLAEKTE